ncbi:DUF4192 domain-containing protein [Nocardioides sp.]|uniref:DUF4192 domain-containing protein n=1 Tax=Nocardioides sp. TaxID=35761 RepID=UPI00352978AA
MEPTTLTARTPEDLLALAPLVLGFQPEESLVMLTFGARAFHARVDLPDTDADVPQVVEMLLTPVLVHDLRRVAFLVFSGRAPRPGLARALVEAFTAEGVSVVDVIQADGRQWFPLPPEGGRGPAADYDLSRHRFAAEGILRGQVTYSSRAALAASIAPSPSQVARTATHLAELPERLAARQRAAEAGWLRSAMAAADRRDPVADPDPGDLDTARLVRDLADPALWEVALRAQSRECADSQTALWTHVLRAAPPGWVAGPASLLGFVAWLGGQGALAWCAIDRCRAERPDDGWALALSDLLLHAVPPSRWRDDLDRVVRDLA